MDIFTAAGTNYYIVVTSLRTFKVEAFGIGDAIEKAMMVCVQSLEYIRSVSL